MRHTRDMTIISRRFGSDLSPDPGRYHLLVSDTCPWCRRALISWEILGLDQHLSIAWAIGRNADGFIFNDPVTDVTNVRDLYYRDPNYTAGQPITIPLLVDKTNNQIVANNSGDLMRDAATAWRPWRSPDSPDLLPENLTTQVESAWFWVDENLSPLTHRAITGDNAATAFKSGIAELDHRISAGFLVGPNITLADIAAYTPVQSWLWAGNEIPENVGSWAQKIAAFGGTAQLAQVKTFDLPTE